MTDEGPFYIIVRVDDSRGRMGIVRSAIHDIANNLDIRVQDIAIQGEDNFASVEFELAKTRAKNMLAKMPPRPPRLPLPTIGAKRGGLKYPLTPAPKT